MGWFSKKRSTQEPEEIDVPESSAVTSGPFDHADHPDREDRLDAGSLWIPQLPGAAIQFSTDATRSKILAVMLVKDGGALQLQAFAAPRSAGLWDSIRLDMMTSIAKQGGSSREEDGPFGVELRANLPVPNATTPQPHRFIGIDGPRWLLRATIYGRAATDDALAREFLDVVRAIVVVRGSDPHPPRELLPLVIPSTKS